MAFMFFLSLAIYAIGVATGWLGPHNYVELFCLRCTNCKSQLTIRATPLDERDDVPYRQMCLRCRTRESGNRTPRFRDDPEAA